MRTTARFSSCAAIIAACFCVANVFAAGDFAKGKQLFAEQRYAESLAELRDVDRSKLATADAAELDRLMGLAPQAIEASERARQESSDGDIAFAAAELDRAERLYKSVLDNAYATSSLKAYVQTRLNQVAEQRARRGVSPGTVTSVYSSQQQPAAQHANPAPATTAQSGSSGAMANEPVSPPSDLPNRLTVVDEMRQRDDLLWQRAEAKMQESAAKARESAAAERWTDARKHAENALQVVEANRAFAQPPARYEAAREAAKALKEEIQVQYEDWSMREAARTQEEIANRISSRRAAEEQQRREKIEQLFNTADQLRKEQRFADSAEAVRQILILDPANSKAALYLDMYEDYASLVDQNQVQREVGRQMQGLLLETEETRIPWHHDILYPKNWLEISARRDRSEIPTGSPDEDSELNRQLTEAVPEVDFQDQPFEQVMNFITDLKTINVAVDWEDLRSQGIERDKPVTVQLKQVSLKTALNEVLSQVGGEVPLGFSVGDGLLRIATREKLNKSKFINVYDIRDLIVRIPRFTNAPQLDLSQAGQSSSASGSSSIFGNAAADEPSDKADEDDARSSDKGIVTEIMDIIRQTVQPDSWRESGGEGALRELNGQLIVYNTSDAHTEVVSLLEQLRASRALMISVESRFLIVTSNFLEEIGVDLDFVFNAGEAGFDPAFNNQGNGLVDPFTGAPVLIPRQFSRTGVNPAVPAVGANPFPVTTPVQPFLQPGYVPQPGGVVPSFDDVTPIPLRQGSLNLVDPRGLNTGIPGSLAQAVANDPGLRLAGSYLDNLQVDFLIRATQANQRSTVVQAPRLMLFNGQRAWVAVVRNRQYVSSVTANVAEGAVGVQPVIANAQSGTSLDIEGTISAKRKYVTLTVRTGLAEDPTFDTFQVQRQSGNSPGIFVLLPDQETRGIRTTVSVPDGGTVLIGGIKQVGEIEIEAGVPILSKIPILKRAFTNTTTVKDTQTLLILLKAKILIQEEAEAEAFPQLSSIGG